MDREFGIMMRRVSGRGRHGFALAAMIFCFTIHPACCRSFDMLKNREISTHREVSDGLRSGGPVYFLCDYVLSEPGSTIMPMYMHSPGKTYYDAVHLYSFDPAARKIARLATLRPTSSRRGRGSVKGTQWAINGPAIYMLYHTGWSDTGADMIHDLFEFDPGRGIAREVSGTEKEELIRRLFSTKVARPGPGDGGVPSSRVRHLLAGIDDEAWRLPLPADYADFSERECTKILVEQRGDAYFRRAALRKITPALTEKKARDIIASMEKHTSTLAVHERMIYRPGMEEWSARISVLAAYKNADTAGRRMRGVDSGFVDAGGRTPLMIAAYFNDTALLGELIRAGAAIDARDAFGRTPLMYAIFGLAPDAMEYLLKRGADVKASSASGWTAWMFVSHTDLREGYLGLAGK